MNIELKKLTEEELKKLEKYIISNTSVDYKEYAEKFAEYLQSGKVDTFDANLLDQIYEGLTDIVKSWYALQNIADNQINLVDIICAPDTKIGKFLKDYNKPQITLEECILNLKEDEDLIEVLKMIADVEVRKTYLQLNDYDLNHTKRTLFLVAVLMNMRKDLSKREKEIIYKAVEFHDIGRLNAYNDNDHAQRAIEKLTNELDEYSLREQEIIKFLIRSHCRTSEENGRIIESLNTDEKIKERYKLYIKYVKDSDKLDRVRFPEISNLITNALDPERLGFEESKQLIVCACFLLENFNLLLNIDPGDETENYLKSPLYNINEIALLNKKMNSKITARFEVLKGIKITMDMNKKKNDVVAKNTKRVENHNVFKFFDQNISR